MNFIIHIIGLPGSGKSTVAKIISKQIGIPIISTEEEGINHHGETVVIEDRDFSEKELKLIYQQVKKKAELLLRDKYSIIIEGVFRTEKQRNDIIKIANKYSVGFIGLYIISDEAKILRRLVKRKSKGTSSPAGVSAYFKIKSMFETPSEKYFIIKN